MKHFVIVNGNKLDWVEIYYYLYLPLSSSQYTIMVTLLGTRIQLLLNKNV